MDKSISETNYTHSEPKLN